MTDTPNRTAAQDKAIQRLANDLHRLNNAVIEAVEAGMNVELVRASRYHDSAGNWGDMLVPIITPNKSK